MEYLKAIVITLGFAPMLAPAAWAALVEEVVRLPVQLVDRDGVSHQHTLTLTVFRDDARARSPFMIVNHGRSGAVERRAGMGRVRYSANAGYFVERGFAVFVPTRIGYGVTGGPDLEQSRGPCHDRDFAPGFDIAAAQNLVVIQYAKSQPFVDATRGVLVGQSVGGATTVALAAQNIAGVSAAINFAGGAGGNPAGRPNDPCSPRTLAQTYADYGKSARTPMLWLYSENDLYWGKTHPRLWFERYKANGAPAEFVQLPAHGEDGHSSFTRNPAAWRPQVERFLKSFGYTH
ncbi:MAG: dienelactone hydrolase [Betaproteobacteria bacterium]|nr:dienelactone hydrolase [Betaproteobacteria bacterium]